MTVAVLVEKEGSWLLPRWMLPQRPRRRATHRDHFVLQVRSPRQAEAKASTLLLVQDGDMDGV